MWGIWLFLPLTSAYNPSLQNLEVAAEEKHPKETEFSILHRDAINLKFFLGPPCLFLKLCAVERLF